MIKRFFTTVVLLFLMMVPAFASHYMGGEIWWECLPGGQYKFHARLYQECAGIDYMAIETMMTNIPGLASFPMNILEINDITPVCYNNPTFPHLNCDSIHYYNQPNHGGVKEWVYQSTPMNLPAGGPPATGWVFAINICNRNNCTNIDVASQYCGYLRAIMYPYPDITNYSTCWDNSPKFIERPSTVICTGYPFTYNPNAYDMELDSLSYEWAQPLTSPSGSNTPTPITGYNPGYSYNSPLPGTLQNPLNVPATVNPNTGEISFTSYTQGAFVTVNKVSAFKCGVLIAEIFREMQIVLLACGGGNTPPQVIIQYPNGDTLSNYVDTVYAGAKVKYDMWAYDGQILNDSVTPQNITVNATGLQLGENGISTTVGCLNPPCAQLFWGDSINPLPLPALGVWALNTTFKWHTDCSHLATQTGCGGVSNVYNFIINTSDDYCPAPAIRWTTITIVVKNPILTHPDPTCITTLPNGFIHLEWSIPDTSVIPNMFSAYYIYRSKNLNGPYVLYDSLSLINHQFLTNNTWTDTHAHGNDSTYFYYLQTRSGCDAFYSGFSDTISNILLTSSNAGNNLAHNVWTAPFVNLPPTSTGVYTIYRKAGATWIPVNTSTGLSDDSPVTGCGYVTFRVGIEDSSGCESLSNIDSALFQASSPPDLRCAAVEPNGDVTISFIPPADISDSIFSAYLIYSAPTLAGPFNLIDSVTAYSQHTKTITALNANPSSVCLYMINRINCDGYYLSEPTDTLKTMHLNITSIDLAHANLVWNEIHQPPLPTTAGLYDVFRNYPANIWDTVTHTPLLSIFDSLYICNDTIPYNVKIRDESGCYSVSNIAKVRYGDNIPPPVPVMDTVSIDSLTGYTHVSWIANGPETVGYILFYNDGGTWTRLDTIWGQEVTHYLDSRSPGNGCDGPKSYVLASFDSCWNTSAMSLSDVQNTLHMTVAGIDPCASKITLTWNPYQNMKNYLGGYKIFVSENGGPTTLLGTCTPASPGGPVPTSFVHENYKEGSYYCYYVQAYNDDGFKTSTSCNACILGTKPKQPLFIYNRFATVESNNKIRIRFQADTSAYISEYKILRAIDKNGPYEIAGVLPFTLSPDMEFTDNNVNPLSQSYYYSIAVVDSCGREGLRSDTARTILLFVDAKEDFTNQLTWNAYEGWTWSYVKAYNIYRGIDGLGDPIPIASVPGDSLSYSDDVSPYFETQGKFRYYIEALEGQGSLSFRDTSYSNRANDVQNSKIFIPNAFSPKGYNSIFKPISIFADKTDYVFMIYNRWGELLFSTNNPEEGWDGRFKGDFVPVGVYIYYVRFNTSEGKKFEKRSTVTVIK